MPTARYTHEQFIAAWLESKNILEVAQKLNVSKYTVERVARNLRKAGVELPTMRENPLHDPLDVDKLNAMIKAKLSA
jgi:transposase